MFTSTKLFYIDSMDLLSVGLLAEFKCMWPIATLIFQIYFSMVKSNGMSVIVGTNTYV